MSERSLEECLAAAHRYLVDHAAAREARLVATLASGGDGAWLDDELAAWQQPTGAIARGPGTQADLVSTLEALAWLDALGRSDAAPAARAAVFLGGAQADDGSWPDPARGDPLIWTCAVAGTLAKTPFGSTRVLQRSVAYLAKRWSVDLVQAGELAPISGYFHVLTNFPGELNDEALQWCGRELERGFRTGAFEVVEVARVFVLSEALALPGARLSAAELVEALREAQQPDGGYAAGSDALRRDTTRDAAVALVHLLGGRRSC